MMHWLLILTLTFDGQSRAVPWALLADAAACQLTGGAVVAALEAAVPGLVVTAICAPEAAA